MMNVHLETKLVYSYGDPSVDLEYPVQTVAVHKTSL